MSAMENAFERRSREAMERRRVPAESDEVIALPDISQEAIARNMQGPDTAAQAPKESEAPTEPKRYFMAMLNEVSEAPRGGRFVLDPAADSATTPGAFEYHGHRLRSLTPEEVQDLSAITMDNARRETEGAKRLSSLDEPASELPPRQSLAPEAAPVAGTAALEATPTAAPAAPPVQPQAPPAQPPKQPPNPPEVGQAPDIQPGPQWAAGYFAGTASGSWRKFDAARFADVKALTRDEIRLDPAKQQLFGELITALDPAMAERIANRIASQTLDPRTSQPYDTEEQAFDEFARFELSTIYKRFETVQQKFDVKELERLLATRDDSRALVGHRGPEHTVAEFKKEIMHTLVRGRADSDKFFDNFKKLTDREATSRGQAMERKIQGFCEKHNIPRANYDMLIVAGDKAATRENLERYIHDHSGKFRKWVDTTRFAKLLPGTSYRTAGWQGWRARRAAPTESKALRPRSWATSDIHEARRDIGEFLSMTVAGPEFRQRLEHYAASGETIPEPSERQGPRTFAESRTEGVALTSERNVQRMFNRDLGLYATRAGYTSVEEVPMNERQAFHQGWAPGEIYEQAGGRGLGVFSIIARAIARFLFGESKKKVSLENIK